MCSVNQSVSCTGASEDENAPWVRPRTVVQGKQLQHTYALSDFSGIGGSRGDDNRLNTAGRADTLRASAYYEALKNRLAQVPIRSRHRCQQLYRDKITSQYWLGITASITDRLDRREILKPLSLDAACSLCNVVRFPDNPSMLRQSLNSPD